MSIKSSHIRIHRVHLGQQWTRCRRIVLVAVLSIALLIMGTTTAALAAPLDYDANSNGTIERDEVILAIKDYFAGKIDRDEVVEVIKL